MISFILFYDLVLMLLRLGAFGKKTLIGITYFRETTSVKQSILVFRKQDKTKCFFASLP